ncbi:molybdate ABC transporter permease subunit [Alteromonas facilis]|uniref:molybdate ABC transporter permease subunit n=1 Tax=Alteromonas facilis TaxID=2048004 RepID=UPI000C2915E5|nr:molybdate ABC transporter permease subunit [Alteromonas facilis]
MQGMDWQSIWLTLKLAVMTTVILIGIATPLAWWLVHWQSRAKSVVYAVIALPLVLPPTVLGFYLLVAFSPNYALGHAWLSVTGTTLAFSFWGILVGSVIYSLPFAVQPLVNAFAGLEKQHLEYAKTIGLTKLQCWREIILPLTKPGFVTAMGLSFAHTLGEFGVVLMIGGNIPGETRVVSIALFDHVESMDYASAHQLALLLLIFSFVLLTFLYKRNAVRGRSWI